MKVTESKKVIDIVRPPVAGMPEAPSVAVSTLLIHAVERMLEKNITSMAVQNRGRVVGHIRLSDALQRLGLTPSTSI